MKTTKLRFLAFAVFTGGFISVLNAQVLILTGHVTDVLGSYVGSYSVGDEVKFSFDFSPGITSGDLFHGTVPGQALYEAKSTLTVGGRDVLSLTPFSDPDLYLPVSFFNKPAYDGLYFAAGWGGVPFGSELRQQLVSTEDILPSVNVFPEGIPMGKFYSTAGSFSDYTVFNGYDIVYTGRVLWDITDYTGSVNTLQQPLSAVPEPSTYGIVGALGLAGLVLFRRRRAVFALAR